MPTAEIEDPLTPLMSQFEMGLRCRKLLRSGDRCIVQPLSRRNGDEARETSLSHLMGGTGATEMAEKSMGMEDEAQSTEALRSLWRSSQAVLAYSL